MATRISAGFKYIYWGVRTGDTFLGGSLSALTPGGGRGMTRLLGAQTAPIGVGEPEIITVLGDDQPLVTFEFDAATLPAGVIEMAVRNDVFEAIIQGTEVETGGDMRYSVLQPRDRAPQDMYLLLQRRGKKWGDDGFGTRAWEWAFVPLCTITPLGAEFQTRQNTPYRYQINLNNSEYKPWGATFTEVLNGTTAAPLLYGFSDNPIHLMHFLGDNAEDEFTLDYPAISTAKTVVYQNGVKLNSGYTAVDTLLTITSPPATSMVVGVPYEVLESDLT